MEAIANLFSKGGLYIFPLMLCSIFGLGIFLQKIYTLRRSKLMPPDFLSSFYETIDSGGIDEAKSLCMSNNSMVSKIGLVATVNSNKPKSEIQDSIEEVGKAEAQVLEKNIDTLLTISSVSTLIGLLGTISGMIKVFAVISEKDIVDPPSLAGGISEALYTTALGLTVAIPALIAYKYVNGKFRELAFSLEEEGRRMLEEILTHKNKA